MRKERKCNYLMHEACSQKSNQEIQRIYFIMYCIYKSTYIYIEQGQGHIHHDLHTVVVGGVQVQGHQETTEAVEGQGHQKGQDHPQEEGINDCCTIICVMTKYWNRGHTGVETKLCY